MDIKLYKGHNFFKNSENFKNIKINFVEIEPLPGKKRWKKYEVYYENKMFNLDELKNKIRNQQIEVIWLHGQDFVIKVIPNNTYLIYYFGDEKKFHNFEHFETLTDISTTGNQYYLRKTRKNRNKSMKIEEFRKNNKLICYQIVKDV